MARDSLGKKTHLDCALQIFTRAGSIWPIKRSYGVNEIRDSLQKNDRIRNTFKKNNWPFDIYAIRAHSNRFFRWLTLDPDQQKEYPTVVMSKADSIPLRQSLYVDFIFGTPEAIRAVEGIFEELSTGKLRIEISSRTHDEFCEWVGISKKDNTRRGPFCRWLEDTGLGIPIPERGLRETGIILDFNSGRYLTEEAFVYSLIREYANPFDGGGLRPIRVQRRKLVNSLTRKLFFLSEAFLSELISKSNKKSYLKVNRDTLEINPTEFSKQVQLRGPLISPSWIDDKISPSNSINREMVSDLLDFPQDTCFAEKGNPFLDEVPPLEVSKRVMREKAFRERIAHCYSYRCAISSFRFRSISRNSIYGDAAHIVPHSGKDKQGNNVYGSSDISNGIFLRKFYHWCFDNGWITFEPQLVKGKLKEYKLKVATIAVDSYFEEEREILFEIDNRRITELNLPVDRNLWPSIRALKWHEENVFDG
jgi:hypothetical protein